MARYKYAFEGYDAEKMARAAGRDIAVSLKQAIEISNFLRKKRLLLAKQLMEGVVELKTAVPYKRFTDGVGHRRGQMASGRYPVKAAKAILTILESAEANAQSKGLNTKDLVVHHMCAHKAHTPVHYGRHGGREFKRCHVEIVLKETAGDKKEKKAAAKAKPSEKPVEKPAEKTAKTVKEEKTSKDKPATKPAPAAQKPAQSESQAPKEDSQ